MSNELGVYNVNETDTIYVILRNAGNRAQVWDNTNSELVTAAAADIDDYDVPLTTPSGDTAGTYYYMADFPAAAPAGTYIVEPHVQAGAGPAWTDLALAPFIYVSPSATPTTAAQAGAVAGQAVGLGVATLKSRLMTQFTGRVRNLAALGQTVEDAIGDAHDEMYAMGVPSAERVLDLTVVHASGTCTAGAYDAGNDKTTVTATAAVFLSTHAGYNMVIDGVGTFYIETYTSTTEVDVTGDASAASADTFTITPGYVRLPNNYGGIVRGPKAGLYIDGEEESRIQWADPLAWPDLEARYGTDSSSEGTPERWTIRYRSLNDIPVAVVEFLPYPNSAITVKGFAMSAGSPTLTFGTAGGSDDYSYLPRQFNRLLVTTAKRILVCESGLASPADPIVAAQEMREVRRAWEAAYLDAQSLLDELRDTLEDERVDVVELAAELQSAMPDPSDEALYVRLAQRS